MQTEGSLACKECASPIFDQDVFCGHCGAPVRQEPDDPAEVAVVSGGIFVSYRRQESSHLAGRLYDRLADRFGEAQVFIDVDTIEPGADFAEAIFLAVAACKVLLVVIGPTWLSATDERGRRRLDDPDDIVRLEIEAALARGVRVIPILVEDAVMPAREDLPQSLAGLARRNAVFIRHESFRYDTERLVAAIQRVLAATSGSAGGPRRS
jgi:TIR domain